MNSERRQTIRKLLQEKPFVSLKELAELFPDVSGMTLRRDIDYFESHGEAIKVRHGARSMKFITTSMEEEFPSRLRKNIPAKEVLAKKALDFIESGRSIFLDSGTTMLMMAAQLPDERLILTTTGPNIAIEAAKKKRTIVNLVGGMLNGDNISVVGTQALRFLSDINIDTAFIVPSGFSVENGLTCGNYSECEIKRMIVEKAKRVVVLLDISKLDKDLSYTFCEIRDLYTVIANGELPEKVTQTLKEAGVQIVIT